MKKHFPVFATMALSLLIVLPSCNSNKPITQYCSVKKYPTTKDYFRASATGESPKMEYAKKISRANARTELGTAIRAKLQVVTENYSNQDEVNLTVETMGAFEELARITVDEVLLGSVICCEEVLQMSSGGYICYSAVELSGSDAFNKYAEKLSNDERTRLDANLEDMRELFESEMSNR